MPGQDRPRFRLTAGKALHTQHTADYSSLIYWFDSR